MVEDLLFADACLACCESRSTGVTVGRAYILRALGAVYVVSRKYKLGNHRIQLHQSEKRRAAGEERSSTSILKADEQLRGHDISPSSFVCGTIKVLVATEAFCVKSVCPSVRAY